MVLVTKIRNVIHVVVTTIRLFYLRRVFQMNISKSARIALEEDNYEVPQIEEIIKFESMAWESDEVENEYLELAIEASQTNEVVYGPFFVYEIDED